VSEAIAKLGLLRFKGPTDAAQPAQPYAFDDECPDT
jgi:hypothetical protein